MNGSRFVFLAVFLGLLPSLLAIDRCEQTATPVSDAPPVVAEFLAAMPQPIGGEDFVKLVKDQLWNVYSNSNVSREELEAYVKTGSDGSGLAYAAFALVAFHHPDSAAIILGRALDKKLSNNTRWFLLNAAPCVLAMGDVWYLNDGALGEKEKEYVRVVMELTTRAQQTSVGNSHAVSLARLYREGAAGGDLGLLRWQFSTYLIGTIDLRDHAILAPRLDPRDKRVFINLMTALSYAMNRDYLKELRGKNYNEVSPEFENVVAQHAQRVWAEYLQSHPDGDWKPAALEGFALAGYNITADLHSKETRQELKRVLEGQDTILLYNACRLLNSFYGTRYDLERSFFGAKYALGPFDPASDGNADYHKLLDFWKVELSK